MRRKHNPVCNAENNTITYLFHYYYDIFWFSFFITQIIIGLYKVFTIILVKRKANSGFMVKASKLTLYALLHIIPRRSWISNFLFWSHGIIYWDFQIIPLSTFILLTTGRKEKIEYIIWIVLELVLDCKFCVSESLHWKLRFGY